eukprot:scaffold192_cov331-Pavlova_lutheri.AAC.8
MESSSLPKAIGDVGKGRTIDNQMKDSPTGTPAHARSVYHICQKKGEASGCVQESFTVKKDTYASQKMKEFGNDTFGYVKPGQYIFRGHMLLGELYTLYGHELEDSQLLVFSVMHWNVRWPKHNGTLESYTENICMWISAARITFVEWVPSESCGKKCKKMGLKIPELATTLSKCGFNFDSREVLRLVLDVDNRLNLSTVPTCSSSSTGERILFGNKKGGLKWVGSEGLKNE